MKPDTVNPAIVPPAPAWHALNRREDHLYAELTRINNELANLQRELAHTNADLVASHKKLEASEQRYRSLSACSPIGIFEMDATGRCVYTNSRWQAISGLTAGESLGDGWQRALDQRDAPIFLEERSKARDEGREFNREVRFVNTRGEQRWAQVRSRPITAADGEATGRVSTVEDITERKRTEETLREKEHLLSESQRLGHIGSWFGDVTGPLSWSEETYRIYGVSPDSFTPSMESLLGLVHPEDRPAVRDWQTRCAAGQRQGELEFRIKRPDGSIRFMKRNGEAVYDVANRFVHMAGTVQDITERKQAQAERETLERRVAEHQASEENARLALEHEQQSSRIKSRFVSLVSHEFRTPLSIINMAAELLDGYLDKLTEEERTEHLKDIRSSVGRMTQMMNDFLIHGNGASGKLKCQPARVNVEGLCRRLIAEVPDYSGLPRAIACTVDPAVGEAWLDEKFLGHILGNLLSNAVKYSSDGQPVKLEVKRVAGSPQPNGGPDLVSETHLEFKVMDSGIGIPAADMAKLYQTFHRAANVGNRPGTGMGLTIVKQFVDLHRGTIRLESQEGKGTTVWVELPIASPASSPDI